MPSALASLHANGAHATSCIVTTVQGDSSGSDFLRDWQVVHNDASIQFAPLQQPKPPEQAQWLKDFIAWLGHLLGPVGEGLAWFFDLLGLTGPAWPWIGGALLVVTLGLIGWRWLPWRKPGETAEDAGDDLWAPVREAALGLLEDADRLADEGRFDEATHLLLQRSVGHIAALRPGLLHPSSTAREIAALPVLSEAARGAFGTIAERVERSLFALRSLDAGDWQTAREAYARFALAPQQGAI